MIRYLNPVQGRGHFPLMHSINQQIVLPDYIIIIRLAHEHIRNVPVVSYISNSAAESRIPHSHTYNNKLPKDYHRHRFAYKDSV